MLENKIKLGNSGLMVSRIGIASSYSVGAEGVELAYDNGINYFYWGSFRTSRMADGIRSVAARDREGMVLVVQSYTRIAETLTMSVERALRKLKLDYTDVLLLGMFYRKPGRRILETAERLKERGLVKHLALSTHKRSLVPVLDKEKLFEFYHIRYNAVHRGAEKDLFPLLVNDPGIVVFTSTSHARLLKKKNIPEGVKVPLASDCYRFVLSHPSVHTCVTGPRNTNDVQEIITEMKKGPMGEEELKWMRGIGDTMYKRKRKILKPAAVSS